MWKAAFTGRSDSSSVAGGSNSGRRKKRSSSSTGARADSIASAPVLSRREPDEEDARRTSTTRHHRSNRSAYSGDEVRNDGGRGSSSMAYVTAPGLSSRAGGGPGALTESAIRALDAGDEDEWEDEVGDVRSERRSKRGDSGDGERKRRSKSGKERSRSRGGSRNGENRERRDSEKRRESSSYGYANPQSHSYRGEKKEENVRGQSSRADTETTANGSSRSIPTMGGFDQFPQHSGALVGPMEPMMSGGLPSSDAAHQFPDQNPSTYTRPQFRATRSDSYGAAAEFYLDEGQSVATQPGVRSRTPNMPVNPDTRPTHPSAYTGNGSAAVFYSGKTSSGHVTTAQQTPSSGVKPSTTRPGRATSFGNASTSSNKPDRVSAGASAAAASHHQKQSEMTSVHQQTTSVNGVGADARVKPSRQGSEPRIVTTSVDVDGGGYYMSSSQKQSLRDREVKGKGASDGVYSGSASQQRPLSGTPGKQSMSSANSNVPLYTAGVSAAATAANGARQHSQQQYPPHMDPQASYYGRDIGPTSFENGGYMDNGNSRSLGHEQHRYHEHKGPMTRLKDGLLNLISAPEDVQKMEEYTEYIGVCKHCFDPRSDPRLGPRQHHYHGKRRDSFEDLRRRKSAERLGRKGSNDSLRRAGSTRIDKDSRYYGTTDTEKRKSGNKADLLGAGLAAAGVAAGANALFNDRKDFDDVYSVKSGHRAGSAMRHRSRSSSRERRRRSSHGVIRDREEFVTVRTKDGSIEQRRVVHPLQSRSRERTDGREMLGRTERYNYANSRSRSHSPGLGEIFGFTDTSKSRLDGGRRSPNGSYLNASRPEHRLAQQRGGVLGSFFSPSQNERKERRRNSRDDRKNKAGFFNFGNDSSSSSDADMAFGGSSVSRASLPLRKKPSTRRVRRTSDEHLAATVAGIGATAAALAAAQKGHRVSKRSSRPELAAAAARNRKQTHPRHHAHAEHQHDLSDALDEDEWEDELPPSDGESALAFGESRLSHRQSMESMSSGDGLSAWGWRWGGKDKKKPHRRSPSPNPVYTPRPSDSFVTPIHNGAPMNPEDTYDGSLRRTERVVSGTSLPQQPMQYIDPQPISDSGSRHPSMPGAFEPDVSFVRPGPGPIQHPKPVAPATPAFVRSSTPSLDERPALKRSASSPTRGTFAQDAALIGGAALATAGIIASSARRSKELSNVRFGLTEEQQRKEDREKRHERERREEERRRAGRTRALKQEAERHAEEEDARRSEMEILRTRKEGNSSAAEAESERQYALIRQREAEEQAEMDRQRQDSLRREKEYGREQARLAEEARQQEISRRQWEAMAAEESARNEAQQRADRDRRDREIEAEIERKRKELEGYEARQEAERQEEKRSRKPSVSSAWGPVAAGAAAAVTIGAVMAGSEHGRHREHDREKEQRFDEYPEGKALRHPIQDDKLAEEASYAATKIVPDAAGGSGSPIMDDDLFDREFFKRSDSEYARHAELARKAADKVVADMDAYYAQPAQTQADFFAPKEILSQVSAGKTKVVDPDDDNDVLSYSAAHEPEARDGYAGERQRARYGVPTLNVIAPTPPPGTPISAVRGKVGRPSSPLANAVADEPAQAEVGDSKRDRRSMSISWGEDSTHVYDPPTPESFRERVSIADDHDVPHAPLDEVVVEAASPDSGEMKTTRYSEEDLEREQKRAPSAETSTFPQSKDFDEVVENSTPGETPSFYRQPFFESASDIGLGGFSVESPGTEGAPPVRGFVEGETDEPTPAEERAAHVPGGFEDDVYGELDASRADEKYAEFREPERATEDLSAFGADPPEKPVWEPPLSKKEKKKREKAAKQGSSTYDDLDSEPTTPVAAVPEPASPQASMAPAEDQADYFVSKKEKKKREKAALVKRAAALEGLDAEPITPPVDTGLASGEPVAQQEEEPAGDYFISKKDKKKRDKALKRGLSNISSPLEPETKRLELVDESSTQESLPEVESSGFSKKEQRKAEKAAKKLGFAEVAQTAVVAAGLGAVAASIEDNKDDEWSSPGGKKSKKGKKAREPVTESATQSFDTGEVTPDIERDMPGGWDNEGYSATEKAAEVVDPFQYQIKDEPATTPSQEVDPGSERADTKKSKKKKKRDSGRFNEPAASSPLRSEWSYDDYVGERVTEPDEITPVETDRYAASKDSRGLEAQPDLTTSPATDRTRKDDDFRADNDTRRMSPEDARSRSVASEPSHDGDARRRSSSRLARSEAGYADDREYDDGRSVAASEPVDGYASGKRTKRRSRRDDDDTASVSSSRSRREREKSPPVKKEKKGGLFGLFSRISSDTTPPSQESTRSDESPSTPSMGDGRDDEDGNRERKHRRRKHREGSVYGDDDGTRSVASEPGYRHLSDEEDEDSRERRQSSRQRDDEVDTRSEPDHRHRHRHNEDDNTERRHHRRRRTDEDAHDSKKQGRSFLGTRVEDLPPLPASPPAESPVSASVNVEQGFGTLVSAEPVTHLASGDHFPVSELPSFAGSKDVPDLTETDVANTARQEVEQFPALPVSRPETPDAVIEDNALASDPNPLTSSGSVDVAHTADLSLIDELAEHLPALPPSRPESRTALLETPTRPVQLQRPTSSTAIPLRFPFGHHPPPQKERATSFSSPIPASPASPTSTQKKSRPLSSEIRPLYLVERNRKPQEVEEALPSLPSSKPSSRASSVQGSEEWHSAGEDPPSPGREPQLTIDTHRAGAYSAEDDYLDSEETTPKARDFPQTAFERPSRQQPQYYTWEDFEQDERLHGAFDEPAHERDLPQKHLDPAFETVGVDRAITTHQRPVAEEDLPGLPASRAGSPYELERAHRPHGYSAQGIAASATLGRAAGFALKTLKDDGDSDADEPEWAETRASRATQQHIPSPLPATDSRGSTARDAPEGSGPEERPSLLSRRSSKKRKGKKGKKWQDEAAEEIETPIPDDVTPAATQQIDDQGMFAGEQPMEESVAHQQAPQAEEVISATPHHSDRREFPNAEQQIEERAEDQAPKSDNEPHTQAPDNMKQQAEGVRGRLGEFEPSARAHIGDTIQQVPTPPEWGAKQSLPTKPLRPETHDPIDSEQRMEDAAVEARETEVAGPREFQENIKSMDLSSTQATAATGQIDGPASEHAEPITTTISEHYQQPAVLLNEEEALAAKDATAPVDHSMPVPEEAWTPQSTRKQSKKGKKKQKAAAWQASEEEPEVAKEADGLGPSRIVGGDPPSAPSDVTEAETLLTASSEDQAIVPDHQNMAVEHEDTVPGLTRKQSKKSKKKHKATAWQPSDHEPDEIVGTLLESDRTTIDRSGDRSGSFDAFVATQSPNPTVTVEPQEALVAESGQGAIDAESAFAPAEPDSAPQSTRKQSKKAKKQKALHWQVSGDELEGIDTPKDPMQTNVPAEEQSTDSTSPPHRLLAPAEDGSLDPVRTAVVETGDVPVSNAGQSDAAAAQDAQVEERARGEFIARGNMQDPAEDALPDQIEAASTGTTVVHDVPPFNIEAAIAVPLPTDNTTEEYTVQPSEASIDLFEPRYAHQDALTQPQLERIDDQQAKASQERAHPMHIPVDQDLSPRDRQTNEHTRSASNVDPDFMSSVVHDAEDGVARSKSVEHQHAAPQTDAHVEAPADRESERLPPKPSNVAEVEPRASDIVSVDLPSTQTEVVKEGDEVLQNPNPISLDAPTPTEATRAEQPEASESFSWQPTPKKSKKDKKGKQAVSPAPFEVEPALDTPVVSSEASPSANIMEQQLQEEDDARVTAAIGDAFQQGDRAEVDEPDEGDPWTPPSSKKRSKKGKRAVSELPVFTEEHISSDAQRAVPDERVADISTEESISGIPGNTPLLEANNEDADVFRTPLPGKKKGQEGMKAKQPDLELAADLPSHEPQVTPLASETMISAMPGEQPPASYDSSRLVESNQHAVPVTTGEPRNVPTERGEVPDVAAPPAATAATPDQDEPDDLRNSQSTRRKGKKGKKSRQVDPHAVGGEPQSGEQAAVASSLNREPEPSASSNDAPQQDAKPEASDEWAAATPANKKKKGKKGRSFAFEPEPERESEVQDKPTAAESTMAGATMDDAESVDHRVIQSSGAEGDPQHQQTVAATTAAHDEQQTATETSPAPTDSNDGSNHDSTNKTLNSFLLSEPVPLPLNSDQDESSDRPEADPSAAPRAPSVPAYGSMDPGMLKATAEEDAADAADHVEPSTVAAPTKVEPDDEWSGFAVSGKKKKKGKRGKRDTSELDPRAERAEETEPVYKDPSASGATEQEKAPEGFAEPNIIVEPEVSAIEDLWFAPAKGKKGKKGKKSETAPAYADPEAARLQEAVADTVDQPKAHTEEHEVTMSEYQHLNTVDSVRHVVREQSVEPTTEDIWSAPAKGKKAKKGKKIKQALQPESVEDPPSYKLAASGPPEHHARAENADVETHVDRDLGSDGALAALDLNAAATDTEKESAGEIAQDSVAEALPLPSELPDNVTLDEPPSEHDPVSGHEEPSRPRLDLPVVEALPPTESPVLFDAEDNLQDEQQRGLDHTGSSVSANVVPDAEPLAEYEPPVHHAPLPAQMSPDANALEPASELFESEAVQEAGVRETVPYVHESVRPAATTMLGADLASGGLHPQREQALANASPLQDEDTLAVSHRVMPEAVQDEHVNAEMTKKAKKKGKKSRAASEDTWADSNTADAPGSSLAEDAISSGQSSSLAEAGLAIGSVAAVIAAASQPEDAVQDDWAGFATKRSKKEKGKGKKSGSAAPADVPDQEPPAVEPVTESTSRFVAFNDHPEPVAGPINVPPFDAPIFSEPAERQAIEPKQEFESAPQPQVPEDDWASLSSRKLKNDKKKARQSGALASTATDVGQDILSDTPRLEAADTVHAENAEAMAAPSAERADLGEASQFDQLSAIPQEPEAAEEDWAGFSEKRSKKDKKRAKKGGMQSPAATHPTPDPTAEGNPDGNPRDIVNVQYPDGEALYNASAIINDQDHSDEVTPAVSLERSHDGSSQPVDTVETVAPHPHSQSDAAAGVFSEGGDLPAQMHDHAELSSLQERHGIEPVAEEPGISALSPANPTPLADDARDVDFAATLAAGLADSGFDPNLVVDDPTYHRRASPPGTMAEADPDEVFAATTTKRGKKSKKSKKDGLPIQGTAESESARPDTQEPPTASVDFDQALATTLQSAGFDPALLQQAVNSGEATPGTDDVEDEPGPTFTTSKQRKKGKRKAATAAEDEPMNASENFHGSAGGGEALSTAFAHERAITPTVGAEAVMQGDPAVSEINLGTQPTNSRSEDSEPHKAGPGDAAVALDDPAGGFVIAGDRDLDVDEMDRAYSAYKKKDKRKKKKERAANLEAEKAKEVETTGRPPLNVRQPERSANSLEAADRSKISTEETGSGDQASRHDADLPSSWQAPKPVSPTSRVQGVFPGLERIKRRQPSVNSPPHAPTLTGPPIASPPTRNADLPPATDGKVSPGKDGWTFAALDNRDQPAAESPPVPRGEHDMMRDSEYQGANSPLLNRQPLQSNAQRLPETIRDSGYEDASGSLPDNPSVEDVTRGVPGFRMAHSNSSLRSRRSAEPLHISTTADSGWNLAVEKNRAAVDNDFGDENVRTPSQEPAATPLESTTKNRASYLFQSPPGNLKNFTDAEDDPTPVEKQQTGDYIHSQPAISSPPPRPLSPRMPLEPIPEEHNAPKRSKAESDVGGPDAIKAIRRTETPQAIRTSRERALSPPHVQPTATALPHGVAAARNPLSTDEIIDGLSWPAIDEAHGTVNINQCVTQEPSKRVLSDPRSSSVLSNRSNASAGQQLRSPGEFRSYSRVSDRSSTPTLRRIDRSLSGDLRAASRRGDTGSAVDARSSPRTIPFEPPPTPPLNDDEDVNDGSAVARAAAMSDVFQGYGDAHRSQVSPTRPPSVRKRQSIHIGELEARLEQLEAENRALQDAKYDVAQGLGATAYQHDTDTEAIREALEARDLQLRVKDAEVNETRAMLQSLQEELAQLSEFNNGLTEANRNLVDDTNGRYATLQQEHAHANEQWQTVNRELDAMRQEHGRLTSGMRDILETEIATAMSDKNAEILRLREDLDIATEQTRALQVQIQSSRSSDFLTLRDEDYFDGACQKLCQHVQQWVLRFSKLSDNHICRLSTELNDDKLEARLDNAILDGSDVDKLLGDRVRRRDVFMSVVMTMVWEYVFTRYLFGMDREQRQKLKALEKVLADVGPPRAVAQWRATTLTLLSRRPDFSKQCTLDTEAVAHEIFGMLGRLLPPPTNTEQQLLTSLQKVIRIAVDLSIEMRTQRAEYIMLPPLQPEYDTNGDLLRKVPFNASLMNERSGLFSSNQELEHDRAVVKIVLFPLVVKKGDEFGEGEEEIVVCPAQVLVHNAGGRGKKVVRVMSGAMEIDDPRRSRQSLVSTAPPGSTAF